ncbi:MAG TPA: hypothetical protein VGD60_02615 [Candidatus Acidoferrales bacterium]
MRLTFKISAAIAALLLTAMVFQAWLASHDEQLRLQAVIKTQSQQIDAANTREHDRAAALDQTLAEIEKLKRETQSPQQILQQLPKYLPLPQPITMADPERDAPQSASASATEQSAAGTSRQKGIGDEEKGTRASPKSAPARALNSVAEEIDSARRAFVRRTSPDPDSSTRPTGSSATPAEAPSNSAASASAQVKLPEAEIPATASAEARNAVPEDLGTPESPTSAEIPAADLKPLYDYVQDCRACQAELSAAKQNHVDDSAKLAALTRERDAALTAAKGGTFWRRLRRNVTWLAIGAATGAAIAAAAHHTVP